MSELITLYARREPTTDATILRYAPNAKKYDVCIYSDKECKTFKARFVWHGVPRKTRKTVMLNCWKYALEWLPEASEAAAQ